MGSVRQLHVRDDGGHLGDLQADGHLASLPRQQDPCSWRRRVHGPAQLQFASLAGNRSPPIWPVAIHRQWTKCNHAGVPPCLQYQLFPGFPLTSGDYQPLLDALGPDFSSALAHSHGALAALAKTPADQNLILMAPSDPRRPRPLRRAQSTALAILGHVPVINQPLARWLRRRCFAATALATPIGAPLPLADAAARLRDPGTPVALRPRTWVLTSPNDPRHNEQLLLAQALGAVHLDVPGGHMFPLTHPEQTAAAIHALISNAD